MQRTIPARRLAPAALSAALLALALGGASTGSAAKPANAAQKAAPAAAAKSGPTRGDRDDDKIFDDLEKRLAPLPATAERSVIVTVRGPATVQRTNQLEGAVGDFDVTRRFSIIDGFAARVTKKQVAELAASTTVLTVEENSRVRALNDGAQAAFGVAKARIDVPSLDGDGDGNAGAYSGADLVAAVIDTGIHAGHADLDEGKVLAFKDFVNGRADAYDDHGHGTHVAATIAGDGDGRADGAYRGVAPAAALVGVKALDGNGGGTMATVTAAIDWVVQVKDVYGIEAINLSLGAAGCGDGTDATSQAVNRAAAAGLVVVVAAGNEGPGTCTVGAPAAAAGALTVGAMADTASGGFKQASFSSRGPTADGRVKPDVSAPGVGITSAQTGTTTGYVSESGTSMATPFVAGVALLMRDANPALTSQQVKDKAMATAVDWGRSGSDSEYGAGRLDAYAALASAGAPLGSGPATPRHEYREGMLGGTGAYVDYQFDVGDVSYPIAATMIMPAVTGAYAYRPDFDLYLYGPSGSLVASAETVSRQEDVTFKPAAAGRYTLRVRSYSGSGAYYVDLSAGIAIDTTAPIVTSVLPADTATGVAVSANASVTFSEPMDAASAQSAFSLVRASDGAAVGGTFSWSGNTMVFDPSADLAAGTEFRATVTTAAKDKAGNALQSSKAWTFVTAAAATTLTAYPSSVTVQNGSLRAGSVSSLSADDGLFLQINSTTSSTYTTSWYGRFAGVARTLKSLKVAYSGLNSRTCAQTIFVYRWTDGVWVQLDSRSVGTTETAIEVAPGGTLANYVSGTTDTGDVAVRVRCQTTSGKFSASGDLLKIVYTK